jgi:two-component system LytT family response regulator
MAPGPVRKTATLIVDDEALARESLRTRLLNAPDITIVGEAVDGPSAVKTIGKLKPDLVFLDIQMPGYDGFEVLRRVGAQHLPSVIFVTAYDRYAIKAFEIHAVDYLLKPVIPARLQQALRRVRESIDTETALVHRHETLIGALYPERAHTPPEEPAKRQVEPITRVAVKHGARYVILRTDDIDWIDSAANYVEMHAHGGTYLLRKTMHEFEERLPPRFARIHRTHMVNIERVREVVPVESGDFDVILRDGTRLKMSRTYKENFFARMNT